MTPKEEVEAAAIEHINCPHCSAFPGQRCQKAMRGGAAWQTEPAATHQRRLSAFISSEHCRFSISRPIHLLKDNER